MTASPGLPHCRRDGINIYANTHDENNNGRYYQWRFVETWEYTSKYFPAYELRNGVALPNMVNVNQCWITRPSSEILIASSTQLNENAIRNFPLIFIPKGSQKISRRYSIIVEQRSLTKEAYDFWNELKKTTENLGGLFDPLPSKVIGNLRSKNDIRRTRPWVILVAAVLPNREFLLKQLNCRKTSGCTRIKIASWIQFLWLSFQIIQICFLLGRMGHHFL